LNGRGLGVDSVISGRASESERRRLRSAARLANAIARAEAALRPSGPPVTRPVFVVFSGLPASGKSFLARRLQPHLCAVIIETDHVRRLLFRHPRYTPSENAWVYNVCYHLIARQLEAGHQVVFDATNLVERHREMIYAIADQHHAGMVIVHTVAPEDVVRQRMERRRQQADDHDKSDADMAVYAMLQETEQPIARSHLVIDTTEDSDLSVQRILQQCTQVHS
jgi:uncharacterized protein